MAIKPPAWCSRAVPVPHGWKHWATSEILLPKKFTQEQIDEFWAEKNGTSPVEVSVEPPEEPVESEPEELESMSKDELEELGREHGVELDRRKTKKSLIEQMKGILGS